MQRIQPDLPDIQRRSVPDVDRRAGRRPIAAAPGAGRPGALRKASVDALDAAGTDLTRVTTRAFAGTIADTADMRCETWWLVPEIAFSVQQRPNPFSATRGGCVGVLRPGNAFAVRRLRQVANPKKVAPCQKACNALPACTEATFAVVPRRRGEGNHDTARVRSGGMAVRFL